MEPATWFDRLTDGVSALVPDVDVQRVDDATRIYAKGDVVCTVHAHSRSTAGILVSTRGSGASPETRVDHGEPHYEAIDEFSLLTLPRAIASSLTRT